MSTESEPSADVIVSEELNDGSTAVMVGVVVPDENGDDEPDDNKDGVSDAVAIAQIEAETEVVIASIEADVTIASIEAQNERANEPWQELETIRTNMLELAEQVTTLSSALAALSTPTPLPELEAEDPNSSTPPFTSDPTNETETEVSPVSEEEKPEANQAPARKRRRMI